LRRFRRWSRRSKPDWICRRRRGTVDREPLEERFGVAGHLVDAERAGNGLGTGVLHVSAGGDGNAARNVGQRLVIGRGERNLPGRRSRESARIDVGKRRIAEDIDGGGAGEPGTGLSGRVPEQSRQCQAIERIIGIAAAGIRILRARTRGPGNRQADNGSVGGSGDRNVAEREGRSRGRRRMGIDRRIGPDKSVGVAAQIVDDNAETDALG
jgi:hypothetical protein